MQSTFRHFCFFVLAALLFAPAALAQDPGQPQPQQVPEVEVNDQQLEAVAKAYISVHEILEAYQAQLSTIQDPEEAKQVQQQLAVEANEAIEAEGITPQLYDDVLRTAQVNEALRDRLVQVIERLAEEDA